MEGAREEKEIEGKKGGKRRAGESYGCLEKDEIGKRRLGEGRERV